jgi:hypothetical protein
MVRPIVLLFQEFATTTATPTTPDLNCVVVGPAYQIQDYPDDKEAIEVSAYGTQYANNVYIPPVANVAAITLAAAPGLTAGAWVDPASVKVYFDEVQAILASGSNGVTVVTAPNENTFTASGATFITSGVAAGDKLICRIPGQLITVVPHLVLTVLSVDSETVLRVTSNFTAADTALEYRVERRLTNQLVDSSFVVTPTFKASNEITILGGVTVVVGATPRVVAYARVYVEYRAFRTDLQALDTVSTTTEIETKIGRIDSRNPLAGALSVARQNAGSAPIQFYGVVSDDLVGYNKAKDALSPDESVYAIVPLTTNLSVISSFKSDNEQLADPNVALSNGVPQKLRVVIGSGALTTEATIVDQNVDGNTEALTGAVPSGTKTLNLVGLTALSTNLKPGDKITLSASENVATLDGTYTVAHINSETQVELDEALPAVVGSVEGVNYTVTRPSTGATVVALVDNRAYYTTAATTFKSRVAGLTPGTARTIALVQNGTTANGIFSIVEVAGVSTIVNGDFTSTNISSQELVDALNTGAGVTTTFTGSINLVASTSSGATAQVAFATTQLSTTFVGADVVTTAILNAAYIRLYDTNAAFITAGVVAGDIIEIPSNPNGVFTTTFKQFTVDHVVSEQRLQITNIASGAYQNNTSVLERELPHADNRLGTGTTVSQGSIRYRVIRELSKDQQVAQLVTSSQSLNSRRAILCWPDSVFVDGLVDGSKTPNSDGTAAAADPQPGWYLSAMVGGMTAGLPSQQGFSRLGGAGVSRLTHSSDYFSETQLTDLSDGGWYVFAQNSPTSLPYSIHQLTTDPATLESGEYSIVKNFDFVSLYYLSVLEPFLGVWNVNNDTLGFMRQAVNTATDSLKLRRVAKIGAPINGATLTSIAVSTASSDRVEIYVEVDLPKPLNVIGLHLVA